MAQILTETVEGTPIARPRWLVLFCLHQDFDTIFNHAQHQPENDREWSELQWAYDTIDLLPELGLEATWGADTRIPPFFVEQATESETEIRTLYDMVKYIFKKLYNCCELFDHEKLSSSFF